MQQPEEPLLSLPEPIKEHSDRLSCFCFLFFPNECFEGQFQDSVALMDSAAGLLFLIPLHTTFMEVLSFKMFSMRVVEIWKKGFEQLGKVWEEVGLKDGGVCVLDDC